MSPEEIKDHRKKFEDLLLTVRKFLESARGEGVPVWQLDIKEIEILLADFENNLLVLANVEREWTAKQPEIEATFRAVEMEFSARAKKFAEIHSEAEYEAAQRLRAELVAHQQVVEAKFAHFIDAIDQCYNRLLSQQQRLRGLLSLDTEGNA